MAVVHTEKETLIISAKSSAMKPIVWKANQQKIALTAVLRKDSALTHLNLN